MAIIKNPTTVVQNITNITEPLDVNFYDYDGSLVYTYSKTDFLALSSMPANPTHTGLVAQGWNWSLSDAKTYVTSYNKLNIGQMYTTASGKSEFDITLTAVTGLSVTLNMDGTKDWGDGSTPDTATSHTYSTAGDYTISCDGTTFTTSSSKGVFGQTDLLYPNYYIKNIRIAGVTSLPNNSFTSCHSLRCATLSTGLTSINNNLFRHCRSLSSLTIPNTVTIAYSSVFWNCSSLVNVNLPKELTTLPMYLFYGCTKLNNITISDGITKLGDTSFKNCYSLTNIIMPNSISTIGSSVFDSCYALSKIIMPSSTSSIADRAFYQNFSALLYDFSSASTIPSLSDTNAFTGINAVCKIVVPDNLYSQWITESNWSDYADYIYKASDV